MRINDGKAMAVFSLSVLSSQFRIRTYIRTYHSRTS